MSLPVDPASASPVMTPLERRASSSLALIFALRMLGLFIVLPVFALEARRLPGGEDVALVGLAMGLYGLTQGMLQIPFGIAIPQGVGVTAGQLPRTLREAAVLSGQLLQLLDGDRRRRRLTARRTIDVEIWPQ